jgi:hypothetical protein
MPTTLFADPSTTKVLTLRSILEGRPILFVEHDQRGGWHFFDGRSVFEMSELTLASLGELVGQDPSLDELANLPGGWRAWRTSQDSPWQRESSETLEKTRGRTAQALADLQRHRVTLPPGSASTADLLREDRDR